MTSSTQHGFTLPEMLASFAAIALLLSFLASTSATRLDAAAQQTQRAETERLAALVELAWQLGRLDEGDSGIGKLRAAMPGHVIPDQLSNGQAYDFSVHGGDPRLLVHSATPPVVVRPPLPVAESRIPFWRARQLSSENKEAP